MIDPNIQAVGAAGKLEGATLGVSSEAKLLSFVAEFGRKARFGVVGWGVMAKRIAQYCEDGGEAEVVGIVPTSNVTKLEDGEFLDSQGLVREQCYTDLKQLLDRCDLDTIVVASPNISHAGYAALALRAGKDVILEKPATTTLSQALELAQLAREKSAIVTVNYVYSTEPMLHEMAHLINQGFIGDVTHVRVAYLQDWLLKARGQNWRQQRDQVGNSCAVADIGVHAFEAACIAASANPLDLQARLFSILPENQLEDYAHLSLGLQRSDGTVVPCHIEVSQVSPGYANQLTVEVHGSKCGLRFSNETTEALQVLGVGESTLSGASAQSIEFWGRNFESPTAAMLASAYREYTEAGDRGRRQANIQRLHLDAIVRREISRLGVSIETPTPYRPSLEVAGIRGMALIENALKSNENGGRVIPFA